MYEKRVKKMILQWVIPSLAFVIVISVMLVDFFVNSRKKEEEEVENLLVSIVENYADDFGNALNSLLNAAVPLSDFVGRYSTQQAALLFNAAKSLADNTDAYMVVGCNLQGQGITQDGTNVNLRENDYFPEVSGVWKKFITADDDGFTGKSCIIAVIPIKQDMKMQGYLLAYYDMANFASIFSKSQFDVTSYYGIVDDKGKAICDYGPENSQLNKADFWNSIRKIGENVERLENAQERFNNNQPGMIKIETETGKRDKALLYAPVGVNSWKLVIITNYSYVDGLTHREWEGTKTMLIRLLICIPIFVCVIVVSNIIYKVKENENKRDLENKADTDLLTGLNNKAATERKIRDYLQEHPNQQSVLFLFDIDNFKKINDTMGHAFGDQVLQTLGHQIVAYFRVSDIVGRIGGDEFMIFLKDIKDENAIRKEAHKLELFFKNFQTGEYVKYSATASIGAAVYPQDAKDFESLYKMADKALYTSKQRGKNRLTFCQDISAKEKDPV